MQGRILLVDDDASVRQMFATGLGLAGYEIVSIGNPELVLERVQTEEFDYTLLDMMMPRMSGIEMLAKARQDNTLSRLGKIIAFTSLDKNLLVKKLAKYGVHHCLDKSSLTPSELVLFLQTGNS